MESSDITRISKPPPTVPAPNRRFCVIRRPSRIKPTSPHIASDSVTLHSPFQRVLSSRGSSVAPAAHAPGRFGTESVRESHHLSSGTLTGSSRNFEMKDSLFSTIPSTNVRASVSQKETSVVEGSPNQNQMQTATTNVYSSPEASPLTKSLPSIIKPTIAVLPPTSLSYNSSLPSEQLHTETPLEPNIFESAFTDQKVRSWRSSHAHASSNLITEGSFTLIDFSGSKPTPLSHSNKQPETAASRYVVNSGMSLSPQLCSSTVKLSSTEFMNRVCELCCVEYEFRLRLYRFWLQIVNKFFAIKHVIHEILSIRESRLDFNSSDMLLHRMNRYWTILEGNTMEMQLNWVLDTYRDVYCTTTKVLSKEWISRKGAATSLMQNLEELKLCRRAIQMTIIEFTAISGRLEAENGANAVKLLLQSSMSLVNADQLPNGSGCGSLSPVPEICSTPGSPKMAPPHEDLTSAALQMLLYGDNAINDCPIPNYLFLPSPDPSWSFLLQLSRQWSIYISILWYTSMSITRRKVSHAQPGSSLHIPRLIHLEEKARHALSETFLQSMSLLISLPQNYVKAAVPFRFCTIGAHLTLPFTNVASTNVSSDPPPKKPVSPFQRVHNTQSLENSLMLLQLDNGAKQNSGGGESLLNPRFLPGNSLVLGSPVGRELPPNFNGKVGATCSRRSRDSSFISLSAMDSGMERESLLDASLDASLRYISITSSPKKNAPKMFPTDSARYRGKTYGPSGQTVRATDTTGYSASPVVPMESFLSEDGDAARRNFNWLNLALSLSVLEPNATGGLWQSKTGMTGPFVSPTGFAPSYGGGMSPAFNWVEAPPAERRIFVFMHMERVNRNSEEYRETFHRLVVKKCFKFLRCCITTTTMLYATIKEVRGVSIVRHHKAVRRLWTQVEEEKMLLVHQLMRDQERIMTEYEAVAAMLQEVYLHRVFLIEVAREIDYLTFFSKSDRGNFYSPVAAPSNMSMNFSYGSYRSSYEFSQIYGSPDAYRSNFGRKSSGSSWLHVRDNKSGESDVAAGRPFQTASSPVTPLLLSMQQGRDGKKLEPSSARWGQGSNAILEDLSIPPPKFSDSRRPTQFPTCSARLRASGEGNHGFGPSNSRSSVLDEANPRVGLSSVASHIEACLQGEENPPGRFWGYRNAIPTSHSDPGVFRKVVSMLHHISSEIITYVKEHTRNSSGEPHFSTSESMIVHHVRYSNGDSYFGGWLLGQRHGLGIYSYGRIGFCYLGGWERGAPHGDGVLLRASFEKTSSLGFSLSKSPILQAGSSSNVVGSDSDGAKQQSHTDDLGLSSTASLQLLLDQVQLRRAGLANCSDAQESCRPAIHIIFGEWARGALSVVHEIFSRRSS